MSEPPALIETLRYEGREARYRRLERHLARLAASAEALGFRWARTDADRALAEVAEAVAGRPGVWRVRMELRSDGRVTWQVGPLPPEPGEPVDVAVAEERIDAGDPWRRHKTTRRALYDLATKRAAAHGLADVLFLNEGGGVAEGAISNVFVEMGGRVWTPPVSAGALPGVLRAELLQSGWALEGEIGAKLLRTAERLWIGSSLRGLRRARLRPGAWADSG